MTQVIGLVGRIAEREEGEHEKRGNHLWLT